MSDQTKAAIVITLVVLVTTLLFAQWVATGIAIGRQIRQSEGACECPQRGLE